MKSVTGSNKPLRSVHRVHRDLVLELVHKGFYVVREAGTGHWVVSYRSICEKGPDLAAVGREALRLYDISEQR